MYNFTKGTKIKNICENRNKNDPKEKPSLCITFVVKIYINLDNYNYFKSHSEHHVCKI